MKYSSFLSTLTATVLLQNISASSFTARYLDTVSYDDFDPSLIVLEDVHEAKEPAATGVNWCFKFLNGPRPDEIEQKCKNVFSRNWSFVTLEEARVLINENFYTKRRLRSLDMTQRDLAGHICSLQNQLFELLPAKSARILDVACNTYEKAEPGNPQPAVYKDDGSLIINDTESEGILEVNCDPQRHAEPINLQPVVFKDDGSLIINDIKELASFLHDQQLFYIQKVEIFLKNDDSDYLENVSELFLQLNQSKAIVSINAPFHKCEMGAYPACLQMLKEMETILEEKEIFLNLEMIINDGSLGDLLRIIPSLNIVKSLEINDNLSYILDA